MVRLLLAIKHIFPLFTLEIKFVIFLNLNFNIAYFTEKGFIYLIQLISALKIFRIITGGENSEHNSPEFLSGL